MTDLRNTPTVHLQRLRSRHLLNHRCRGTCEYARSLQVELDQRTIRDASFMQQFYPRRTT